VKDVTDATFETDVLKRSEEVPVVVDLWAPWCMPCTTLGPIIEEAVAATEGRVELAKVDVDKNPRIAMSFRVQSIPAVFAIRDRDVVDSFVGAVGKAAVTEFVKRLDSAPSPVELLVAEGSEDALQQALELEPGHPGATAALAEILTARGEPAEALALLAKVADTAEVRRAAAAARLAQSGAAAGGPTGGPSGADDLDTRVEALLDRVKTDDEARQELVDLLETMDPEDPRRARYRRALTSRLF
jgi:putative thioredoxin